MQNSPAPAAALFRHLDDQSIDHCVLGAPTAERIELVVAPEQLEHIAGVLRAFATRNEMEVIDHLQAPEGVHRYRLSCISREEHPQFVSVEVRAHYVRCGYVIFTADELLSDRVRATRRVAPAKEFLCRLLRCVDAGAITDRDAEVLSVLARLDRLCRHSIGQP